MQIIHWEKYQTLKQRQPRNMEANLGCKFSLGLNGHFFSGGRSAFTTLFGCPLFPFCLFFCFFLCLPCPLEGLIFSILFATGMAMAMMRLGFQTVGWSIEPSLRKHAPSCNPENHLTYNSFDSRKFQNNCWWIFSPTPPTQTTAKGKEARVAPRVGRTLILLWTPHRGGSRPFALAGNGCALHGAPTKTFHKISFMNLLPLEIY